jgi:hypothetical protein
MTEKLAWLLTVILGAALLSTLGAPTALAQNQLSQSCIVNGDPSNHVMPTQIGSKVRCTFSNTDSTFGEGEWMNFRPQIPFGAEVVSNGYTGSTGLFFASPDSDLQTETCYYPSNGNVMAPGYGPEVCVPNVVNVLVTLLDTDADEMYPLTPPLLNGNWTGLCSNSSNAAASQDIHIFANGSQTAKIGVSIDGTKLPTPSSSYTGVLTGPIAPTVCTSVSPAIDDGTNHTTNQTPPNLILPSDETVVLTFTIGGPFPSTPGQQHKLANSAQQLGDLGTGAGIIALLPNAPAKALGIVGAILGLGSHSTAEAAAKDPPDLNYTTVVTPVPPSIDVSGLQPAARQLALTLEQVIALAEAISTTTDRATGAFLDDDSASQQLQLAARPGFENQLQAVTAQLPVQLAAFGQELLAAGVDTATITAAQVSAQLQSIQSNGLPTNIVSALNALGVDQPTQAQIAAQLGGADPALVLSILQNRFAVGPLMPPDLADASNLPQFAAVLPASRSVQVSTPATAFATIINAGTATAQSCGIAPNPSLPVSLSYQTTDPRTNALVGTLNTPVDIAAGASQSFVVAVTPESELPPINIDFEFFCVNANAAPVTTGLNTLLLSASTSPVPDVVALAASGDPGIVDIPGTSGAGAFAVATVDVGASGAITASANTGSATLPIGIAICQTNPTSGACLAAPASSVTTTINSGQTPTFGIFVTGNGSVPFDPANNRVFVQFADSNGQVRGATSVAVRTE